MSTSYIEQFGRDLLAAINERWVIATYGPKPNAYISTGRQVTGYGKTRVDNLILYVDSENVEQFGVGGQTFIHALSASVRINTNGGRARYTNMVSAVINALKANVKRSPYVSWRIGQVQNLSEDTGANYFSGVVDVSARIIDPGR